MEGFADMMNKKAKELGCTNTHFVTPNGLDSADKEGVHETTARDLALIMRYAIKNKTFLYITRTVIILFLIFPETGSFLCTIQTPFLI